MYKQWSVSYGRKELPHSVRTAHFHQYEIEHKKKKKVVWKCLKYKKYC